MENQFRTCHSAKLPNSPTLIYCADQLRHFCCLFSLFTLSFTCTVYIHISLSLSHVFTRLWMWGCGVKGGLVYSIDWTLKMQDFSKSWTPPLSILQFCLIFPRNQTWLTHPPTPNPPIQLNLTQDFTFSMLFMSLVWYSSSRIKILSKNSYLQLEMKEVVELFSMCYTLQK